jgi:GNAT superfamily N-acetyltransferase
MDTDAVLTMFDHEMRQGVRADGPGTRVERIGDVVRQVGADHDWNGVLWSDLDEETADAAIAAQVRHYVSRGQEFEWKLYAHDRPHDLPARLHAAGFTSGPPETLMVAQVQDLSQNAEVPAGVRLRPVTDPAGVDLLAEVHEQAFGTDPSRLRQRLLAQLAEDPQAAIAVVAMAGELPVSAARMELPRGTRFAGLLSGGTVAPWRGRGIYRALIAFRARVAAERGYHYLQVDASSQSRPILQRLGFVPLGTTTPYTYQP